jgi:D-glycero-beta-D-manno-heptose 1-phosphate adenylyltransferase
MFTVDDAAAVVEAQRQLGRSIVFTDGVFDLLHPGHVRYLQAARREGDVLVVGVSSDRSVRANKGPGRPVIPEDERAEIVFSLACVEVVAIFDDDTPAAIVSRLQPDVLVKGADWPADAIAGRDSVEARGGRVVRIPIQPGWSSSAIIDKSRAASIPGSSNGPDGR